jgi:hypothetical protein
MSVIKHVHNEFMSIGHRFIQVHYKLGHWNVTAHTRTPKCGQYKTSAVTKLHTNTDTHHVDNKCKRSIMTKHISTKAKIQIAFAHKVTDILRGTNYSVIIEGYRTSMD